MWRVALRRQFNPRRTARLSDLVTQPSKRRIRPDGGVGDAWFRGPENVNSIQPDIEPRRPHRAKRRVHIRRLPLIDLAKERQCDVEVALG